jgi:GTP-binding protein Era
MGMKSGFVSLVGRPNAGKSTLLNRIVGTKLAIVSDKPQTTRTRIIGVKNYDGAQAVFVDTPGIHRPLHRMNVRMMDIAVEQIRGVDVLGVVADVTEPPGKGDAFVLELVKPSKAPVFLVLNKIDLIRKPRLLPIIDRYARAGLFAEIVPVSAATGENVDRLERAIVDRLPEGEALYPEGFVTDQPERFFAAEVVREKLLQLTRAEIPFSSAVIIDRFEEGGLGQGPTHVKSDAEGARGRPAAGPARRRSGETVLQIHCTIVVERESQKPIVIGRGGEMIKRIGSAAREELERRFGRRVYLDLRVRVKSEWREDDRILAEIGLGASAGEHRR